MQNPFHPASQKEWSDLEELIIAASLVGIPWSIIREAYVRSLLLKMMEVAEVKAVNISNLSHLFQKSEGLVRRILLELSFFVGGRSLSELDNIYTRCAGTLPKEEREKKLKK